MDNNFIKKNNILINNVTNKLFYEIQNKNNEISLMKKIFKFDNVKDRYQIVINILLKFLGIKNSEYIENINESNVNKLLYYPSNIPNDLNIKIKLDDYNIFLKNYWINEKKKNQNFFNKLFIILLSCDIKKIKENILNVIQSLIFIYFDLLNNNNENNCYIWSIFQLIDKAILKNINYNSVLIKKIIINIFIFLYSNSFFIKYKNYMDNFIWNNENIDEEILAKILKNDSKNIKINFEVFKFLNKFLNDNNKLNNKRINLLKNNKNLILQFIYNGIKSNYIIIFNFLNEIYKYDNEFLNNLELEYISYFILINNIKLKKTILNFLINNIYNSLHINNNFCLKQFYLFISNLNNININKKKNITNLNFEEIGYLLENSNISFNIKEIFDNLNFLPEKVISLINGIKWLEDNKNVNTNFNSDLKKIIFNNLNDQSINDDILFEYLKIIVRFKEEKISFDLLKNIIDSRNDERIIKIISEIIYNKNYDETNDLLKEYYNKFLNIDLENINDDTLNLFLKVSILMAYFNIENNEDYNKLNNFCIELLNLNHKFNINHKFKKHIINILFFDHKWKFEFCDNKEIIELYFKNRFNFIEILLFYMENFENFNNDFIDCCYENFIYTLKEISREEFKDTIIYFKISEYISYLLFNYFSSSMFKKERDGNNIVIIDLKDSVNLNDFKIKLNEIFELCGVNLSFFGFYCIPKIFQILSKLNSKKFNLHIKDILEQFFNNIFLNNDKEYLKIIFEIMKSFILLYFNLNNNDLNPFKTIVKIFIKSFSKKKDLENYYFSLAFIWLKYSLKSSKQFFYLYVINILWKYNNLSFESYKKIWIFFENKLIELKKKENNKEIIENMNYSLIIEFRNNLSTKLGFGNKIEVTDLDESFNKNILKEKNMNQIK